MIYPLYFSALLLLLPLNFSCNASPFQQRDETDDPDVVVVTATGTQSVVTLAPVILTVISDQILGSESSSLSSVESVTSTSDSAAVSTSSSDSDGITATAVGSSSTDTAQSGSTMTSDSPTGSSSLDTISYNSLTPPFPGPSFNSSGTGYLTGTAVGTGSKTIAMNSSSSTITISSTSTLSSSYTPPAAPDLMCSGTNNPNWVAQDYLAGKIKDFCHDAYIAKVHDPGSGSLVRTYDNGTDRAKTGVSFSIDWPNDPTFRFEIIESECVGNLTTILNGCDGNDPKNPMNWKHGGKLVFGSMTYHIDIIATRYMAGRCSFHVTEYERWGGSDTSGSSRWWMFHVEVAALDGSQKKQIGGDRYKQYDASNSYLLGNVYYDTLVLTPEAQGDYIRFTVGTQSWTTSDSQCQVGGYGSQYSETDWGQTAHRDMDCDFNC